MFKGESNASSPNLIGVNDVFCKVFQVKKDRSSDQP